MKIVDNPSILIGNYIFKSYREMKDHDQLELI